MRKLALYNDQLFNATTLQQALSDHAGVNLLDAAAIKAGALDAYVGLVMPGGASRILAEALDGDG